MTDSAAQQHADSSVLYTTLEVQRKNFGQMLLEARLQKELTIAEAAEHAHCKRDTVQRLETGNLEQLHLKPYYAKSTIEALCLLYDIAAEPLLDAYDMDVAEYASSHGGAMADDGSPIGDDDESAASATQHQIAQMLIAVVLVAVALLILCGWLYKGYQAKHINASRTYDLPALLPMRPPPMEPLEIP